MGRQKWTMNWMWQLRDQIGFAFFRKEIIRMSLSIVFMIPHLISTSATFWALSMSYWFMVNSTLVVAGDVESKLNSSDGSTSFEVLDSASGVVGRVDSDGNLLLIGTATVKGGSGSTYTLATSSGINVQRGLISASLSTATLGGLFVNGSVGIGTPSPIGVAMFSVDRVGVNDPIVRFGSVNTGDSNSIFISNTSGVFRVAISGGVDAFGPGAVSGDSVLRYDLAKKLLFTDGSITDMVIDGSGNVGIGTTVPIAKLHTFAAAGTTGPQMIVSTGTTKLFEVNGSSITIAMDIYKSGTAYNNPDYVFEPDYPLMHFQELKEFIRYNRHLPNMPSTEQIKREGVKIFEQNRLLLEKIEEAYLYILRLEGQLKKQDEELQKIKIKIGKL